MRILVVNAGSSSLKLSILDGDELCLNRELPSADASALAEEIAATVRKAGPLQAIGHRIVHGGTRYVKAVRIDADVVAALGKLADLAPLHQVKSLAALSAVTQARPDCPAVACFDTAFHATIPPGAGQEPR